MNLHKKNWFSFPRMWTRIVLLSLLACIMIFTSYQLLSKDITIVLSGKESTVVTFKDTVGDFLQENQITLDASDRVIPGMEEKLTDNMTIRVFRAVSYTITVDGTTITGESSAFTVQELLQEKGIVTNELDRVMPEPATPLAKDMVIRIVRIHHELEEEEVVIPFSTITIPRQDQLAGYQRTLVLGTNGLLVNTYLVIYEDGILVDKQLQNTEERISTVNQVIEYGATLQLANGDFHFTKSAMMSTSGYCSCSLCTGKNPGDYGYGITASGLTQGYGVVGVDPKTIPFGTKLYIEGYGFAVAGDTGGAIYEGHIDLGFTSHADAVAWAWQNVMVYFLGD